MKNIFFYIGGNMDLKVGFIGAGNMGSALIKGIISSGLLQPENISVSDADRAKTESLSKETGVYVSYSNNDVIERSDYIILAVKPNMVRTVLEPCKELFHNGKVLISIAAGVPIKTFKDILGALSKIIRTIPNTPALVGEGMTLISCDETITESEKDVAKKLFECVGKVEMLDETLMSEVIALTSSSPAYIFMFIEAMADAAVLSGIPRVLAYKLAAQAVLGSAKMVLETGKHPGELKDQVCSPAGTTIEAVAALEKNGFRYTVMEAMNECTRKARELGRSQ
jgi:pyrroline-5-carboxylate reductase